VPSTNNFLDWTKSPLFIEEQNLYCSNDHTFFERPDELLIIVEISAADYVERGYVTENRRPYELRFNNMVSAFSMEAIALLIFSGAYIIGYLPSQYAKTWGEQGGCVPSFQIDFLIFRSSTA
jgi:DNA-binding transcriptional LysR family regulator